MENFNATSILAKQTKWLLIFIISILSLNIKAQTPQFDWVGSSASYLRALTYDVEIDQQGNIFYAGHFVGVTDFDPGAGVTLAMTQSNGLAGAFVVKLDANKNFLWVKTFVNSNFNQQVKMKLDYQGNVIMVGNSYYLPIDFNPDTAVTEIHTYASYILKLDNNGEFISVSGYETSMFNPATLLFTDMEIDIFGNYLLTGKFKGAVDFNFGPGVSIDSSIFFKNFVLKIDPNGQFLWVKNIGETGFTATEIATDNNGSIYTTASFNTSIDIDPDSTVFMLNGAGNYLLKLDSGGQFIWAKQFSNIVPLEIKTGANNEIYYTGSFSNTADFDHGLSAFNLTAIGNTDIFVSKLTENGNFIWVKTFGGAQNDKGANIAIDSSENVYLAGYFADIVNFSTDTNSLYYQSLGSTDLFFTKLDENGNMLWTKTIGGISTESVSDIDCNNSEIYIGGSFTETVDFDFGPNINSLQSYASPIGGELFVLKLNLSININNDTLTICQGDTLILNSGYPAGNLWNTGDTTQYINVANAGQYYVSINNGGIVSDTTTIIVIQSNPLATAFTLAASDTLICSGSLTQITASLNLTNNQTNYFWSVNGIITNSADSVITFTIDSTANIWAYINNSGVCNSQLIASTNSIIINTFPSTEVTFNSPQANTWLCTSDPAFQITGGTPNGGTYSGSGVSNGLFTPIVSLPNINVVTYTYQDTNLCITQAIDTFFVDVCTVFSPLFEHENVQIFPTPAKDIINIQFTENSNSYFIRITDLTGKIVLSKTINNSKNEINISSLNCGIYFITIMQEDKQYISKFIKN